MTIVEAKGLICTELDKIEFDTLSPNDQEEAVKFMLEKFEEFKKAVEVMKIEAVTPQYPPHEIWRDVVGYEGLYKVSTYANILSYQHDEPKLLKHSILPKGYHFVYLYNDGERHGFGVHVLVAKAFLPNPFNKPEVNHKDGNKDNNTVWNLEWNTYSENNKHAVITGLNKPRDPKLTPAQINEILEICVRGSKECGISYFAKKFEVCNRTISRLLDK